MKSVFKLAIIFIFTGVAFSQQAYGQEVLAQSEPTKKELKLASSLEKAKSDLEKSKLKLANLRTSYDKKRKRFEKQNSKGKLSPNAVASHTKTLNNLSKKISSEESKIQKLEKYIVQNGG